MTQEQKQHAADLLARSWWLVGEDNFLPKVFMVNGKCYWFYNVAKRAAYKTRYPIEIVTIDDVFYLMTRDDQKHISRGTILHEFDQSGSTFNGRLFENANSELAEMVNIPIIPLVPTP